MNFSRIPVCEACLALPKPLQSEFFCGICRTPFVDDRALDSNGLCLACGGSQVNFDAAYAYGSYEGALCKLIHLFKYAKVESLAGPLSRLLTSAIPPGGNFDVILPVPMHWRKRWQRGFNQAELLARPVSKRYGLMLSSNLRRKRYTVAQAALDERQRSHNLRDSFSLHRPEEIVGKRILLIDDVFTTGATLRAATAVLKAAGAARVTALTLARVDHAMFATGARLTRGFDQRSSNAPIGNTPVGGRKTHSAGTGVK